MTAAKQESQCECHLRVGASAALGLHTTQPVLSLVSWVVIVLRPQGTQASRADMAHLHGAQSLGGIHDVPSTWLHLQISCTAIVLSVERLRIKYSSYTYFPKSLDLAERKGAIRPGTNPNCIYESGGRGRRGLKCTTLVSLEGLPASDAMGNRVTLVHFHQFVL